MLKLIGKIGVALLLLLSTAVQAGPQAELWQRWLPHDPTSTHVIDHHAWKHFLLRYLRIGADGAHRVTYADVSPADRALLGAYILKLAGLPLAEYSRDEQLAYWINLYNALVVRLVLEHYPLSSVFEIDGAPGTPEGPWTLELVTIDGTPISLHDIKNRILRPIWRDPRVHYALSCGAVGCPNLQPTPFEGERIEQQLNRAAMAYINDPRCIQVDGDRLIVSSIYSWYKEDFGGSDRAVIRHLMAYAEPRLAMALQRFDELSADMFNWRLNDASYGEEG